MATFGNTNNGAASSNLATSSSTSSGRRGFKRNLPENGIATSISAYLSGVSETIDVTVFINSVGTTMPHAEIVRKETLNLATNTAATWFDFDIPDTNLVAGDYLLTIAADGNDIASGTLSLRQDNLSINHDEVSSFPTGVDSYTTAKQSPLTLPIVSGNNGSCIYCTYTALPTVTINNPTSITSTSATANGNIITIPGGNCTLRGFVYGTTSKVQPNNVSGASSGYDTVVSESGSYATGTYSLGLTGLTNGTTYYIRPFVQDANGYSYGNEVIFTTTTNTAWFAA